MPIRFGYLGSLRKSSRVGNISIGETGLNPPNEQDRANSIHNRPYDFVAFWRTDLAPQFDAGPDASSGADATSADATSADNFREIAFNGLSPFCDVFRNDLLSILRTKLTFSSLMTPKAIEDLADQGSLLLADLASQPLFELFRQRSPEEDYGAFVSQDSTSLWPEVSARFPQLPGIMKCVRDSWLASVDEVLVRLSSDRTEIEDCFSINLSNADFENGWIDRLVTGMSDRHNNGRTVMQIQTVTGSRLIYKPRCIELSASYNQLLAFLSDEFRLQIPHLKTLCKEGYGWIEFAKSQLGEGTTADETFYEIAGKLSAVWWVLDATDLHQGNIFATENGPLLIDAEAFFQTCYAKKKGAVGTVAQLDFFPRKILIGDFQVDITGLGGTGGQPTRCRVPVWQDVGSDRMTFGYFPAKTADRESWIRTDFSEKNISAIQRGFTEAIEFLRGNRSGLLSNGGLLWTIAHQTTRIVTRNTREYFAAINLMLHPNQLRNRKCGWEQIQRRLDVAFTESEIDSLKRCDIPRFTSRNPELFRGELEQRLDQATTDQINRQTNKIATMIRRTLEIP